MQFKHLIGTAGDGLWSGEAKNVQLTDIHVPYITDEKDFGELRVIFDISNWDIHTDGLIYTDQHFINTLSVLLFTKGFAVTDISYSEQGMQGENYVSFDVGPKFIASWEKFNAK